MKNNIDINNDGIVKVKSNRGRKKKVKDNNNPDKKVLGIYIDLKLYNVLNKIKDIDKISINYIVISAIKDYIKNNYTDIWYKDYDNEDKILLNINKDMINRYEEKYIHNSEDGLISIEQSIINMIINKVLGIDKENIDKKDIKIGKEKIIDMFKNFIENGITENKDDPVVKV
jgi:hypothetical protein